MLKKLLLVFLIGFALNLVWEFAHSVLYVTYKEGEITNFILFRAAVMDGIFILTLTLLAILLKITKSTFIMISGFVLAVAIELWALKTGRWVYDISMPIIPFLRTGLTPTIQLALTGYIAQKFAFK